MHMFLVYSFRRYLRDLVLELLLKYYFNTLKPGKCCLLLYGQKAFRRKALLRLYRRRKCEVPASLLRSCYWISAFPAISWCLLMVSDEPLRWFSADKLCCRLIKVAGCSTAPGNKFLMIFCSGYWHSLAGLQLQYADRVAKSWCDLSMCAMQTVIWKSWSLRSRSWSEYLNHHGTYQYVLETNRPDSEESRFLCVCSKCYVDPRFQR